MALKKFRFYVINVKLQSKKEGIERIQAYENLIKSLTSGKKFTRINKSEALTLYPPFEREEKGIKYFYGSIGKGISFFDKEQIKVLNNNTVSTERVDKNKILEPTIGEYLFIPSLHRFALLKKPNSISLNDFEKFLKENLPPLISAEEKITIDSVKEPAIIEEIFKAKAVFSLSYEISYSNNDALNAQGELFDALLHTNNIGHLKVTANSDHNDKGMNIQNVDFLGGGLEVAKNNGVIKNAKIQPLNGTKIKSISNQDKPAIEEFELLNEKDNKNQKWFLKLLKLYKGAN